MLSNMNTYTLPYIPIPQVSLGQSGTYLNTQVQGWYNLQVRLCSKSFLLKNRPPSDYFIKYTGMACQLHSSPRIGPHSNCPHFAQTPYPDADSPPIADTSASIP